MIRRAYIDTVDGQMHIAEAGVGKPLILLPWFPRSGTMYMSELPVFASKGFNAVAVDPMGIGQSTTANRGMPVERHADNIAAVIRDRNWQQPIILAGHYSSQVAVELAHRPEVDIAAVVLDGGPLVPEAVQQELLEKMDRVKPALEPQADGTHQSLLWAQAMNIFDMYAPGYQASGDTLVPIYRFIADYLAYSLPALDGQPVATPVLDYPFEARLAQMDLPCAILSAATETLAESLQPMFRR